MGKKVKKIHRPPPPKGRSPKNASEEKNASVNESVNDEVKQVQERTLCPHLEKGVDLDKLSTKLRSLEEPIRCEDCREGANDRRGGKGKGKGGKKKGSGSHEAVWVCLECGHYACGGIGLPTSPQYHAVRHIRQTRHRLMIQWDKPQLRWCFPCGALIPVEKHDDNGETKDVLAEVVKLIKQRSSEVSTSSADVESVWFGSGSILNETKSELSVPSSLDGRGGYVVRGLVNLGNTCFFNSVMQNLFALDRLRDCYLNMDASAGPITISLKKLFAETIAEASFKNVINPKAFFGCISAKAPQFRGYQQQDSHELLRCLLDGLCAEELGFKKQIRASKDAAASNQDSTLVDALFGGQISSTLCCVECGHSSTVYEPFLDLSLPVPTKKTPSKMAKSIARPKKTKPLPKKVGRNRPKVNKDADQVMGQQPSEPSPSRESSTLTDAAEPLKEEMMVSSGDSAQLVPVGPVIETEASASVSESLSAAAKSESEQVIKNSIKQTEASADDSSWLDFLGPEIACDDDDLTSQFTDMLSLQDSVEDGPLANEAVLGIGQVYKPDGDPNAKLNSSGVSDEEERPLLVKDNEILLLPYYGESTSSRKVVKEAEASPSNVSCNQEELDFVGFGDMFNEPEVDAGPFIGPCLPNEVEGTSFMAGNTSDSDPDEVDDTDSPVSIESCLAHFIKPELLSDDNAWECENCSKNLIRHKLEAKKKQAKTLKNVINGGEAQICSRPQSLGPAVVSNGDIGCEITVDTFGERDLLSDDDCHVFSSQNSKTVQNGQPCELGSVVSKCTEGECEIEDARGEELASSAHCQESSSDFQANKSCSAENHCSNDELMKSSSQVAEYSGLGESEDAETSTKSLKVKRNAIKRVILNKAPPILTIHLKRFSQDAHGRFSKLNGHVKFSKIIDLKPFVDARCIDEDACLYHLVGLVEHSGTMRGGHYVAYVRGDKRGKAGTEGSSAGWFHISDAHVRQVSIEQVLNREAYLLFYERI